MNVISDQSFDCQAVTLDDTHFKDCSFTNCELNYNGGGVILERTSITGCRHVLGGAARATMIYLQQMDLINDGRSWTETNVAVN